MEAMVTPHSLAGFFYGKRVLLTGHTGFKGSWLSAVLVYLGAETAGYSLAPPTNPSLYDLAGIDGMLRSTIADIRDYLALSAVFESFKPEIVLHLAAQPIVRVGYAEPRETYDTNLMGTVNLLECCRQSESVRSVVCVTTDKVYENKEWPWGYRETDNLDGFDPYANSKSCAELAAACYKRSFFEHGNVILSTARAGNVIGGGDFAVDRIIPDCVRAAISGGEMVVRNPYSIRPYQHVLEPVFAYLSIAANQHGMPERYSGCYNIGPDDCDCVTTGALATMFCDLWGKGMGWVNRAVPGAPHEANFLKLDCAHFKQVYNWQPVWSVETALEKTVEWSKVWNEGGDVFQCMNAHIEQYLSDTPQLHNSKKNI